MEIDNVENIENIENKGYINGSSVDNEQIIEEKVAEPKVDNEQIIEEKVAEPKVENISNEKDINAEPEVDQNTNNEEKIEEPKAEEPKAEEPKAEEPKAEEPKAEEPKAEEPKIEEPKIEEPKIEKKDEANNEEIVNNKEIINNEEIVNDKKIKKEEKVNNEEKKGSNDEDVIRLYPNLLRIFESSVDTAISELKIIYKDLTTADDPIRQKIFELINEVINKQNLSLRRKRSLFALTELILKKNMNISNERLIRILRQTEDMNKVKLIAKRKNLAPEVKKMLFKKWVNSYKEKKNWLYFLGKTIISSKKTNEPIKEVILKQNNFARVVSSEFIENILKVDKSKFVIDKILERFGKRQMSLISLAETRKILYHVVCVAKKSDLPLKELVNIETKILDKLCYANNLENKRRMFEDLSPDAIESLGVEGEILKTISLDMKNYCENSPKRVIYAQKEVLNLSSKFGRILKSSVKVNNQEPKANDQEPEVEDIKSEVEDIKTEVEDKKPGVIEDEFRILVAGEPVSTTLLKGLYENISDNLLETQDRFDKRKFGFTKKRSGFLNLIRQSCFKRTLGRAGITKSKEEKHEKNFVNTVSIKEKHNTDLAHDMVIL